MKTPKFQGTPPTPRHVLALSAHVSAAGVGTPAAAALLASRLLHQSDPRRAQLVAFALAEREA